MVYPNNINLNLNTRYVLPIPTAQQGDTARVLTFNILDNGVPFSLTGKTVRAKIVKPDNTKCYNDLTITNATNGECTLKLTNQILAVAGKVNCQLAIKEGEELLSTIIFPIGVEPSIDISGAVESSNEFTALENGLTKLDEWDKYFQETSGAIEEKYTTRLNAAESSLEETKIQVNTKVTKIEGKGLSTNDYDNAEKTKVSAIPNLAPKTYVDSQIENVQRPVVNYNGTLAQLQSDLTVDKAKNYLILNSKDTANYGKACYWNGTTWVSGWTVQGISIADNSVTSPKKSSLGQFPLFIGNVIPNYDDTNFILTFPQGDKGFIWKDIPYDFSGVAVTVALDPTSVGSSYCKIVFNTETKEIKTYTWATWIPAEIREKCLIIATYDHSNKMLHGCFNYTINGKRIVPALTDNEFNAKVNTSLPLSDNYKYLVRNTNNGYLITPNQQKSFDYEEFGSDLRVYIHCDQLVVREGGFISPTWDSIKAMINNPARFVTTPNGKIDYMYLEDGESLCYDTTTNTFKIIAYGSCTNAKYIIVAYNWAGQIIRGTILQSILLEQRKKTKALDVRLSTVENSISNNTNLPKYWTDYLDTKVDEIKDVLNPLGQTGFSFGIVTDLHIEANKKHTGSILKTIDDKVNLSKVLCHGDIVTDGTDENTLNLKFRDVAKLLLPIKEKIQMSLGNHDIFWKAGNTLDKKKLYSEMFRPYENSNVITDGNNALWSYWDDKINKVRYINVNCIDLDYVIITPNQLKFVGNAINIAEEGWSIVLHTHIPNKNDAIIGSDAIVDNWTALIEMLNSCKSRGVYNKTVASVPINIDFTNCKSSIVGIFCGHVHQDNIYMDNTIPVITTLNDSCYADAGAPSRTSGTTTEHAIDIAIVDKLTKTVKLKRIGAGTDRQFTY